MEIAQVYIFNVCSDEWQTIESRARLCTLTKLGYELHNDRTDGWDLVTSIDHFCS